MKIALVCSAFLTLTAACLAMPAAAEDSPNVSVGTLIVEGAFTRPSAPGAKDLEGYFSIINEGSAPDRLVSVTSDISDKTEIQETKKIDGRTEMRRLPDGIGIPAGETVNLAPGGNHVMFLNIHHPVKGGDIVHATLGFENAGQIDIGFHVIPGLTAATPSKPSGKK